MSMRYHGVTLVLNKITEYIFYVTTGQNLSDFMCILMKETRIKRCSEQIDVIIFAHERMRVSHYLHSVQI